MIALLAVQPSTQTFIDNSNFFSDTSDNARYNQPYWLIRKAYLLIIASKGNEAKFSRLFIILL